MGYRIVYGEDPGKKFGTGSRCSRFGILTVCCFLLFLLLTNLFWPAGKQMLWELCIPGDAELTAAAFETMVEDIRVGEPISDALTAFCREVIDGAEDSD